MLLALLSQPSDYVVGFSAGTVALTYAIKQVVGILRPPAVQAVNGNAKSYVTTRELDLRTESVDKQFAMMDKRLERIEDKLDKALRNA